MTPETTVGGSSFISVVPAVTSEMPSASSPAGPVPSSENSRQSGKRKAETDGKERAFRTLVPPPVECINIGFRWDELDPTVLGKYQPLVASVHKYWTSTFEKAADNAELIELLKLAEMYTSRSHVLKYKLYKVLAMKVDELQTPETTVGGSSFISVVPAVTSEMPSASSPAGPVPSSENSRQSGKRKAETDGKERAFRTLVPPPVECINIGFRWDELDPTVLGKYEPLVASVHKYWTSTFEKAADNAELIELLKLAEMYTSRSHVLKYKLYKVLAMKVDELRSNVGGIRC
ncbi:hypothetical protein Fot_22195 [Forsythia ovata]|uniref:Uncharacterized protein n=1 Tax=Forsythia ovata TaxID=205694 RepID=A0ABD1UX13_9LAMI